MMGWRYTPEGDPHLCPGKRCAICAYRKHRMAAKVERDRQWQFARQLAMEATNP